MSQLSSVKQSLQAVKRSWPRIAQLTGVPYSTICKIGCGHTKNPRSGTVQRLADFFASQQVLTTNPGSNTACQGDVSTGDVPRPTDDAAA